MWYKKKNAKIECHNRDIYEKLFCYMFGCCGSKFNNKIFDFCTETIFRCCCFFFSFCLAMVVKFWGNRHLHKTQIRVFTEKLPIYYFIYFEAGFLIIHVHVFLHVILSLTELHDFLFVFCFLLLVCFFVKFTVCY